MCAKSYLNRRPLPWGKNTMKNKTVIYKYFTTYKPVIGFSGDSFISIKSHPDGDVILIQENAIFFIPANKHVEITVEIRGGDSFQLIYINDEVVKMVSYMDNITPFPEGPVETGCCSKVLSPEDVSYARTIMSEQNVASVDLFSLLRLLGLFEGWSGFVLRQISSSGKKSFMDLVVDFVEKNHTRAIFVRDVCGALFISESTLRKRLAREGTSFKKILNDVRMKYASIYLRTTDKRVSEIANITGVGSLSYFVVSFSRYYGMSPKKYRACFKVN